MEKIITKSFSRLLEKAIHRGFVTHDELAKSLGKRIGKAVSESAKIAGDLTSFLSEMLKGSRMIKIYQQEKFEFNRSKKIITSMMEKQNKIG